MSEKRRHKDQVDQYLSVSYSRRLTDDFHIRHGFVQPLECVVFPAAYLPDEGDRFHKYLPFDTLVRYGKCLSRP